MKQKKMVKISTLRRVKQGIVALLMVLTLSMMWVPISDGTATTTVAMVTTK